MSAESDPIPLDGKTPPSEAELLLWRKIMREYSHWSWAKRRLFPIIAGLSGAVLALWHGWQWIAAHVKVTP